jgi:hypothetical protein
MIFQDDTMRFDTNIDQVHQKKVDAIKATIELVHQWLESESKDGG